MLSDDDILGSYKQVLPFIAHVLGPGCEVVLHDVRDFAHSLIAIENSLSNRKVGAPLTELGKHFYDKFNDTKEKFVLDYLGHVNNKEFLDSTFFIRNEHDEIIGLLCVNKDLQLVKSAESAFSFLLQAFNLAVPKESLYHESLNNLVDHMLSKKISTIILENQKPVETMSQADKLQIVNALKAQNIFAIKGAVSEAAKQLNVSIPTIYRYMNKVED